MEFMTLALDQAQLKFEAGSDSAFTGYASVFGGIDSHGDTIHPGAFSDVLAKTDTVKMYFNHGWLEGELPIGLMKLSQDDYGLKVERAEFTPGLRMAQDVQQATRHGTVDGLSIGYRLEQTGARRKAEGKGRDIFKVAFLKEVSVVDWPSDGAARLADVKSAIEDAESLKQIEAVLRDAGRFSRADATALVARIKSLARGERDAESRQAEEIRGLFQRIATG